MFFLLALLSLFTALYILLFHGIILLPIFLLSIGIILEIRWLKSLQKGTKAIFHFVEEKSSFIHQNYSFAVFPNMIDTLRQEGFSIEKYPYGNYYCFLLLNGKHPYHFFIGNNDTPDCKEVEGFSKLFIEKIAEAISSYGSQYFVDFEYGANFGEKEAAFIKEAKKGFMITKDGVPFGFRIAYDTESHTLYYAEAVTNVAWKKRETIANYTNVLLSKLYPLDISLL